MLLIASNVLYPVEVVSGRKKIKVQAATEERRDDPCTCRYLPLPTASLEQSLIARCLPSTLYTWDTLCSSMSRDEHVGSQLT